MGRIYRIYIRLEGDTNQHEVEAYTRHIRLDGDTKQHKVEAGTRHIRLEGDTERSESIPGRSLGSLSWTPLVRLEGGTSAA